MDPFTDVLESVRLTSAVFRRTELNAPWAISTDRLAVGVYHVVLRGSAWITLAGGEPHLVEAGQITVLPHGSGHTLSHDRPASGPMIDPVVDPDRNVQLLTNDGDGPRSSILCGSFEFERSTIHPLLELLPELIVVPTDQAWLHGAVAALEGELDADLPGTEVLINRLSDIVVVSALRNYWTALPDDHVGWLAALRDPELRRAIGLIHRWPERRWTAQALAAEIGLSRATFFDRFTRLVGEPPAQYLTRWRVHQAANLLADGRTVSDVSAAVGYSSPQAFGRAFKRLSGLTPAAYARRAHSPTIGRRAP